MRLVMQAAARDVSVHSKRQASPVVLAVSCALACLAAAPPAWSAEPVEAEKTASEAREAAERERKLNEARRKLDAAAREVAALSRQLSEDAMAQANHVISMYTSRAMLGVAIGDDRHDARKDGVEILSVSPGGPAADAGLKAGDVLTQIKDTPLKQEGERSPREKLLAAMREVDPEEKVQVRYVRDGKAATATIVADRANTMVKMPLRARSLEHLPTLAFMRSHGVFGSAELVAMTPKLGQYFGTEKGLLVVRAPTDTRLKLEEGDVIVDIDGRVPTSASHAVRILSSYQPGEKLKLNLMRMKKRTSVEVTIPEDMLEPRFEGRGFSEHDDVVIPAPLPNAPVPPPAAPAPPRSDTA